VIMTVRNRFGFKARHPRSRVIAFTQ
jgi:hypothetical protein